MRRPRGEPFVSQNSARRSRCFVKASSQRVLSRPCRAALCGLLLSACGGSSPSIPTPPAGGSGSGNPTPPTTSVQCRYIPAAFAQFSSNDPPPLKPPREQATRPQVPLTGTYGWLGPSSPQFDRAANQLRTDETWGASWTWGFSVCNASTRTVVSYASLGDFLDEAQVIPPKTLATQLVFTMNSEWSATDFPSFSVAAGQPCITIPSRTLKYSYDGQRRLSGIEDVTSGGTATTTFLAWDQAGRPVSGTKRGPVLGGSFDGQVTISYNDSARTRTTTLSGSLGTVVTIDTFSDKGYLNREETRSGTSLSTYTLPNVFNEVAVCR